MSLQWTCVAGFLYAELVILTLLMMPFISPKLWANLFSSRFLRSFAAQVNIWFTVALGVLLLFFVDSVRDVVKYSAVRAHDTEHPHHAHMDVELQHQMKMFRAQRNFYIAGFSLFLALVIRRMTSLITAIASLSASTEALTKQAQNAAHAASAAMDGHSADDANHQNNIKELKKQLEEKDKELKTALKDRDAMKTQSLNLQKQYDELCDQLNKGKRSAAERKAS